MPPNKKIFLKAKDIFFAQKQRCNNVKNKAYKNYGALGIRVEYSKDDFINWYLKEYKKQKWVRVHCGRIDHSKNYSFSNIELQEQSANNIERNIRRGNPCKSHKIVNCYSVITKRLVCSHPSKVAAAKIHNIDVKTIFNHCSGKTKVLNKFHLFFKYAK